LGGFTGYPDLVCYYPQSHHSIIGRPIVSWSNASWSPPFTIHYHLTVSFEVKIVLVQSQLNPVYTSLTYYLPNCRVLGKPVVAAIYGTWRRITVFTRSCHLDPILWARWIQSTPSLTNYVLHSMEQSPSWEASKSLRYSRRFPPFMKS